MYFYGECYESHGLQKKKNQKKQCYKKLTQQDKSKIEYVNVGHRFLDVIVMRREKLEHLVTTEMIKGKRSRGKQREKVAKSKTSDRCTQSNEG